MSRLSLKLVAIATLALPSFACGPNFPSTLIDRSDALTAAPYAPYENSLKKLGLPAPEFAAVQASLAYQRPEERIDPTLTAEFRDLLAAGVEESVARRHYALRQKLDRFLERGDFCCLPAEFTTVTGLPEEFALYHTGVSAYRKDTPHEAQLAWKQLLALPETQRKYKSTWAAYMLGRTSTEPAVARAYFQQVRALARAGFIDSTGLAAASYGWEARTWFDEGQLDTAAKLYLDQFATGDRSAALSLRAVATRVLSRGDQEEFARFARDANLRETITALLLLLKETGNSDPDLFEKTFPAGVTARWLATLESIPDISASHAAPLALAAYRADELETCARWLQLAPADDGLALWLKAKLALRQGKVDDATAMLSQLVQRAALIDGFGVFERMEEPARNTLERIQGELGTLKLAQRDYTEALRLLLSANYWEDAAYVAERVLTVDELKRAVDTRPEDYDAVRPLLSRRLVRHGRIFEAMAYAAPKETVKLQLFSNLVSFGRDPTMPKRQRASALFAAARLMRSEGMELRGTELTPDFTIWGGSFAYDIDYLQDRAQVPVYQRPSSDEQARTSRDETGIGDRRFHYRYVAADLAWEAIALMPNNQATTAEALTEAGGWLKYRDPKAANRFYVALVQRCPRTDLGKLAADLRWFPE